MKKISLALVLIGTAITSVAQSDSAAVYYQKGLTEKQNGRRQESLKHFEKAVQYDAKNKAAMMELAAAYNDLRRYPQALELYKKIIAQGDQSSATLKPAMLLAFNMRQFNEAVQYANSLKKVDPSQKVSYYIGKAHYENENLGEAISTLNAAMKEDPNNAEIPYLIARSYSDMQNHKQAIPFFEKAVSLDTSKAIWYYELGLTYYAIYDAKNSLKNILEAGNKGYRKDNEYIENLAIAFLEAGKLDEGITLMKDLLKKRPTDTNILNMVAESYYAAGKYNEAIEFWDQMLAIDKTNASALYMIGLSYQKKGEKSKGQALCDKAIEMDPSLKSLRTEKKMPGM